MEQLVMLTLLSFSMFAGSYVAGTIPMVFALSEVGCLLASTLAPVTHTCARGRSGC